jgi:hypothetical protein
MKITYSPDACTPENVVAKLYGAYEALGMNIHPDIILDNTPVEQIVFHRTSASASAQILEKTRPEIADQIKEHLDEFLPEGPWYTAVQRHVMSGYQKLARPNQILSKEVSQPILDHIRVAMASEDRSLPQYKKEISELLNELEKREMTELQRYTFEEWGHDLKQGYPLISLKESPNWLAKKSGQIFNNVAKNAMDLNTTVILGNPLELLVKLPPTVGIRNSVAAPFKAWGMVEDHGWWGKIPMLDRLGVYGQEAIEHGHATQNWWGRTVMGVGNITQRPLVNIAAAGGYLKGGDAGMLHAIEDVAFLNQPGNGSKVFRSENTHVLRFINYTLSNMALLGGHVIGLGHPETRTQALKALITYELMQGMLGAGSAIAFGQAPLDGARVAMTPGFLDFLFEKEGEYLEMKKELLSENPILQLTALSAPSKIAISMDMTNRKLAELRKHADLAREAIFSGDVAGMARYTFSGLMAGSSLTPLPVLGNNNVQRVLDNAMAVLRHELDTDEAAENIKKKVFPILRKD